MSTQLVKLDVIEPEWNWSQQEIVIGKDVLEVVSTSMYVEPLSLYREYIQNAADSFATALDFEPQADGRGHVEIHIDRQQRRVRVTDFGPGLPAEEFFRKVSAIGSSAKRGTGARGFRGIGRLAALAFCQELVFRTRQSGSPHIHELRWDAKKMKYLLRSSTEHTRTLQELISSVVQVRTVRATREASHFFEVELVNVIRHRDDRILDGIAVMHYLEQVAPVPFHPSFEEGTRISEFLLSAGVPLHPLRLHIEGEGLVYRPHRTELATTNGKVVRTKKAELFVVQDRNGETAAASWILDHEYVGAVPRSLNIAGWRLRSGNIQVGDSALLEDLYPESRFNSWTIAETHVLDPRVLPNARRDNYEHSAFFSDLLTRLTPYTKRVANLCRSSSMQRNSLQKLESELKRHEEQYQIAQKAHTPKHVVSAFLQDFTAAQENLQKLISKVRSDDEVGAHMRSRWERLAVKVESMEDRRLATDPLAAFEPVEREMIGHLIKAVHAVEQRPEKADVLIVELLKRLRRRSRR